MSLYSALYAGVSGLNSEAAAMATVADNITNVNTIGYKATAATFSSMVTGGNAKSTYAAGGVNVVPQQLISKNGPLQPGSADTDMAIEGNGFFVVRSNSAADSPIAYTRTGSFRKDDAGFLRNASGYYLQGWPLNSDGTNATAGNIDDLEPVRPYDLAGSAQPTTTLMGRLNLQSTTTVSTAAATYAVGDMADGTVAPDFSRPFTIYDAQGTAHTVTMGFLKTGPNEWQAELYADPADVAAPTPANGLLASGQILFNGDGSLDLAGSTGSLFTGTTPQEWAAINPTWSNGASSNPGGIQLGFGNDDKLDGLTQSADQSALLSSNIDGGMLGGVASVSVSEDGIVSAIFEDGTSRPMYRLPLATFSNPDGLKALSGNAYQVSQQSGNALINPASQGSGTVAGGQLEGSNADLGKEFTNMILFQRAYSASSKIITTVDDMLQDLSNMKR